MFGLINPLYKIAGVVLFVVFVFGAGYYKGYQKLSEYKTQQEMLNEQIVKRQDIITEGIKNEYKANIDRLRRTYGRVQHNGTTTVTVPSKGTDGASSNLLLDCAITTQQLVSLQDWMTQQLKFQE
ncbi:MAG: hypothetical protein EHM12_12490 [Dehalococcoidia bacterium]|nr:MAG: hypothetical protein EHM12_12490 [Dehalococcoidia bacterium]